MTGNQSDDAVFHWLDMPDPFSEGTDPWCRTELATWASMSLHSDFRYVSAVSLSACATLSLVYALWRLGCRPRSS